jgi:hypothetical protein
MGQTTIPYYAIGVKSYRPDASFRNSPNFRATNELPHLLGEPVGVALGHRLPREHLLGGWVDRDDGSPAHVPQCVVVTVVLLPQDLVRRLPHVGQSGGGLVDRLFAVRFIRGRTDQRRHAEAVAVVRDSGQQRRFEAHGDTIVSVPLHGT